MVTAAYRRSYLRGQYLAANKASASLGSRIYAQSLASSQLIGSQGAIIGTSGNGRSVSFANPDRNKFTTSDEKVEMVELIVEVYETALLNLSLSAPDDTDDSQNTNIFNKMMDDDRMQKVDSLHIDHTLGRWPSGAGFITQ